jgi:nucleoside-diphosphate-sugar epimerase
MAGRGEERYRIVEERADDLFEGWLLQCSRRVLRFVTGATGFIGYTTVQKLINAGHQVLGLARSEAGAQSLIAAGAEMHRGNLEDMESLRSGAAQADGVIHLAFDHSAFGQDFSKFAEVCEKDKRAIEALGAALIGSDRPLITSGTGMGNAAPSQPATEDHFDANHPNPRKGSEVAGDSMAGRGVNVSVVRLPQVHDTVKQGLITYAVQVARIIGASTSGTASSSSSWPTVICRHLR